MSTMTIYGIAEFVAVIIYVVCTCVRVVQGDTLKQNKEKRSSIVDAEWYSLLLVVTIEAGKAIGNYRLALIEQDAERILTTKSSMIFTLVIICMMVIYVSYARKHELTEIDAMKDNVKDARAFKAMQQFKKEAEEKEAEKKEAEKKDTKGK